MRSAIAFYATLSQHDGCQLQATWAVTAAVGRPDDPSCTLPTVTSAIAADSTTQTLVKITSSLQSTDPVPLDLAWLTAPDSTTAASWATALSSGETLPLTLAGDLCAQSLPVLNGTTATPLATTDDWLIFRGNPRDACPDPDSIQKPATALAEASLAVAYSYSSLSAFSWQATYAFQHTAALDQLIQSGTRILSFNLFNARAEAYLGPWQTLPLAALEQGVVAITDPAVLTRILPYQQDLQLVFRLDPVAGEACGDQYVYAYGQAFLDTGHDADFSDATQPGRSRFLLKESDLPVLGAAR